MRFNHSLKFSVIFVFLFVGWGSLMTKADEKLLSSEDPSTKTEDSTSSAPDTSDLLKRATEDFHQILAPLWHQAFPEKDFKTIREKAPLLQEKLLTLLKVKLPSYMEEDEEKLISYLSKRQEMAFYVSQVNLAAADTVDSSLATAFEQMHWAYEEMANILTVQIAELDSFHETLYFLWHRALPARDYEAIRKTAPVLKAEVDSLMKVSLPRGCSEMKDEFDRRKSALKDAVYQLAEACEKGSDEKIDYSSKVVHKRFEELNSLLR